MTTTSMKQDLDVVVIRPKLRFFDRADQHLYDMVVNVEGEDFCVIKMHLASHSVFFDRLFFHPPTEAKKCTVNDVSAESFQLFLELINGETYEYVEDALKLAKEFEAPTAIRSCEHFLVKHSVMCTKRKFELAMQYDLQTLKTTAVSQITSGAELVNVISDDFIQYDESTKEIILRKSIELHRSVAQRARLSEMAADRGFIPTAYFHG